MRFRIVLMLVPNCLVAFHGWEQCRSAGE
jgi:hypothetical protein